MFTIDADSKLSPTLLAVMASDQLDADTRLPTVVRCSPDLTDEVARLLGDNGGTVLRILRAIGAVSVEAPISRIRDLAQVPGVDTVTLDETLSIR